ncbi:MAG TPA: xyloglucanase precursor, partial [Thermoanaerobaculia bacterium]
MQARSIGPAGMSGKVTAVEGVEADPNTLYVGGAAGGVWKTVNGGTTWEPVFDDQPALSIGAIAVFQANPEIVWVGTGEGDIHVSASSGDGVWRSLDGGRTWSHLGLGGTEHIARIVLHPTNPNVAWAAALGKAWGENADRGVYKTLDGGKTWRKVLYVDERTGAADLVIDPTNPEKLFAAMWDYRRWPWGFPSGGP